MLGFESLKDALSVGMLPAAVAILVPWIARRLQDRQRDLQIKTELIAEISGLVMTTVMTIHIWSEGNARRGSNDQTQEGELDRIYTKWRVDTCVTGSKLHAYFPDESKGEMQIHKKWTRFSGRLSRYYETARDTNCKKSEDELVKEKEDLFEEKAVVIEEILGSKITGFRSKQVQKQP